MTKAPRVTIRFEVKDGLRLGPGKIRLLELIDETGSISAAARAMDMSYRRAWVLIDEVKLILGKAAVDTVAGGAGGGGARLTQDGKAIIASFRDAEAKAQAATAEFVASLVE
jgi:molybdate transport system regulatory protein